jgi:septum formation protein
MKLILASASPRRADLLRQVGIDFQVVVPDISEDLDGSLPPSQIVTRLALRKALAVSKRFDQGFVLAADTLVIHRGIILGKPADQDDARRMLSLLSGDEHEVMTGMVLVDAASGRSESALSKTSLWLKAMTESEIEVYIATGEPLDKAGAYGIQGRAALFVEKIEGCYFNVVGLPLSLLYDLMKSMQAPIWLSRKDRDNAK